MEARGQCGKSYRKTICMNEFSMSWLGRFQALSSAGFCFSSAFLPSSSLGISAECVLRESEEYVDKLRI